MVGIRLTSITKRFGATTACDCVDLEVASGEFLTLLGDSGCGKTTLLRIVAGFTTPNAGAVLVAGTDVTTKAPADRGIGFVFQSYALFPTKTVAQNIGFALAVRRRPRAERKERVRALVRLMELDGLVDRFPHELSGGQQQRVALARALAPAPPILLLDEPLSALDARIRAKLREELRDLVRRLALTAIYVTHDQEEAMALSDRIAVMRQGRILQVGTPREIYHRPASPFVARFVGTSNLLTAEVRAGMLHAAGVRWPGPPNLDVSRERRVQIAIRPEGLRIQPCGEQAAGALTGRVRNRTFLGGTDRLAIDVDGCLLIADRSSTDAPIEIGADVVLLPDPERIIMFDQADL